MSQSLYSNFTSYTKLIIETTNTQLYTLGNMCSTDIKHYVANSSTQHNVTDYITVPLIRVWNASEVYVHRYQFQMP